MKRFTLALLTLPLLFASCLGNDDPGESNPVIPGFAIYNDFVPQRLAASDPLEVAMRLNVLLTTAAEQEKAPNQVTVKVNGEDKNLSTILFSSNTVSGSEGVWTLTFQSSQYPADDYIRSGKIVVDTKGKTLEELDQHEYWEIKIPDGYSVGYQSISGMGQATTVKLNVETSETYFITRIADNLWNADCKQIKTVNNADTEEKYPGIWSPEYTISFSGKNMTYDVMSTSTISISGGGTGTPVGAYGVRYTYSITEPLVFNLGCSPKRLVSGVIRLDAPGWATINPNGFPATTVRITWKKPATDCHELFEIAYNGYIYNSSDGTVI